MILRSKPPDSKLQFIFTTLTFNRNSRSITRNNGISGRNPGPLSGHSVTFYLITPQYLQQRVLMISLAGLS